MPNYPGQNALSSTKAAAYQKAIPSGEGEEDKTH